MKILFCKTHNSCLRVDKNVAKVINFTETIKAGEGYPETRVVVSQNTCMGNVTCHELFLKKNSMTFSDSVLCPCLGCVGNTKIMFRLIVIRLINDI